MSIQTGNTVTDGSDSRGWVVGHFIDPSLGLRQSKDVEIKWGIHTAGEVRDGWVTGETRTTMAVLISGKCEAIFRDRAITLSQPGDYVMWGPGTDHTWKSLEDSVVMTVRWPSVSTS